MANDLSMQSSVQRLRDGLGLSLPCRKHSQLFMKGRLVNAWSYAGCLPGASCIPGSPLGR